MTRDQAAEEGDSAACSATRRWAGTVAGLLF